MLVLIADDDAETCTLVSAILRREDHQCIIARDAMQALQLATQRQPDAIVLDLQMPAGTGIGALEKLKRSTRTAAIPVIVLSGTTDPKAADRVMGLGADQFLAKPVQAEELVAAIQRLSN
jgi:CheY-like chemotaxis protein